MPGRWCGPRESSRSIRISTPSFAGRADGGVELVAGGYFDDRFWSRRVAYPAYVEALVASGYDGYIDWEFCHPAMENGKPAGIDYVHHQTRLALEYMNRLRADAQVPSPSGRGLG